MALHDLNDAWGWIQKLIRRVSRLESGAMLENSSITGGRMRFIGGTLRVDSGGSVEIVGTLQIDGATEISGAFTLSSENWNITGPGTISGNTIVSGTLNVTGNSAFGGTLHIQGATTLNNDLTLGTGRIVAGPVLIDRGGDNGGRIASTGQLELNGATGVRVNGTLTTSAITALGNVVVAGDLVASTLDVTGAKNFKMPHPTKPGYWLRHGSTESPISGTEYTGRETIGVSGSVVVELPDYFEALNKTRNRTVQVTPVGPPFSVGADPVEDGKVTIYGEPGRDVFWLVKAERFSGDFLLEEPAD